MITLINWAEIIPFYPHLTPFEMLRTQIDRVEVQAQLIINEFNFCSVFGDFVKKMYAMTVI